MQGQNVVTSDDHKLGTVVDEREGFVVVESGQRLLKAPLHVLDFRPGRFASDS